MKITGIYVYPIKAIRGIPLQTAQLGPQGIKHDRRFMLMANKGDKLKKIQLSGFPQCSLFSQEIAGGDRVVVRYHVPNPPLAPAHPLQGETLEVPLEPDIARLERVDVDLHGSPASAYRVGDEFDAWFSACFGFSVVLVFIGDGRRQVLGQTLVPQPQQQKQPQGWLGYISSYVQPSREEPPWLTFTDCAPFLITTESSLRNVQARFPDDCGEVPMYKFRPNLVVDGEDAWAEDFWGELAVVGREDSNADDELQSQRLLLTGNCSRCSSLNVDYSTGRPAEGKLGQVLKTLQADRRVDKGNKYSPVFGRYAFLGGEGEVELSVGDDVEVTRRLAERTVWDWPF